MRRAAVTHVWTVISVVVRSDTISMLYNKVEKRKEWLTAPFIQGGEFLKSTATTATIITGTFSLSIAKVTAGGTL